MRPRLLLIDDGERYVELLHHFLRDYDYATRCDLPGPCWSCPQRVGCRLTHAHDAAEADEALTRTPHVDAVLLDMAFALPEARLLPGEPGDDLPRRQQLQGLAILRHLRRRRGDLPVILMTSAEELELAFAAPAEALLVDEYVTLAGADAFDARALGLLIERVLHTRAAVPAGGGYVFGRSAAMARLRRDVLALARTSLPVLLLGEPGTGKSALCEQVLHPATGRKGPFSVVDLTTLPSTVVAGELFGTARGAFSGAVDRPGRFEQAHGGTLLLDEIGNLSPEAQRLLLLVLQDGRVTRLGENMSRAIDVKVVAATNADLRALVAAGQFRADLYARLNPAARLVLPPLRERLEDLWDLLGAFLRRRFVAGADRALLAAYLDAAGLSGPPDATLELGAAGPPTRGVRFVVGEATLAALRAHPFPGNVRELELLIGSAAVFALSDAVGAAERGRAVTGAEGRTIPIPGKLVRELLAATWPMAAPGAAAAGSITLRPQATLHQVAQDLERQAYEGLFRETGGDFAAMGRHLLGRDDPTDARRVRLRFNQLGLRARPGAKR